MEDATSLVKMAEGELDAEMFIALIRLASNPMAKALIALAFYASGPNPEVAEAVWK